MNNRTFDITLRVDLPDAFMVSQYEDSSVCINDINGEKNVIKQAVFTRKDDNTYDVIDKNGDDINNYICTVSNMEAARAYIIAYYTMDILVPAQPLNPNGTVNTNSEVIFKDFDSKYCEPTPITVTKI